MMRKRDAALQAFTILLALGVGILLGGRACPTSEPTEQAEAAVHERVVEVPRPYVVFKCPPVWQGPREQTPSETKGVKVDSNKKLPEASPPARPVDRRRLLAWVRDQARDLDGCRPVGKDVYRLAVTVELDEQGKIRRVNLNVPPGEVPSDVQRCLRQRISGWEPPDELVRGRRELLFGLTI